MPYVSQELLVNLQKLLLIAMAGGLGTLARYTLADWVQRFAGEGFPWGTVTVNLLGCLLFGAIWSALESRWTFSPHTRAIVLTGFMGAFTTFSTFIFETGQLMRDAQWLLALGNVSLQNVVGIAALFVGLAIGRLI